MGKAVTYLLCLLVCISLVSAMRWDWMINPSTGKPDRSVSYNQSGQNETWYLRNVSADYCIANISFSRLYNLPAACPANSGITQLVPGGTTICTVWDVYLKAESDSFYLAKNGTTPLTGNWNYGSYNISGTGRVGIGTQTPTQKLDVNGTIASTSETNSIRFVGGTYPQISAWDTSGNKKGQLIFAPIVGSTYFDYDGLTEGHFLIRNMIDGDYAILMAEPNGNIRIGNSTVAANYPLQVVSDTYNQVGTFGSISGSTIALGQASIPMVQGYTSPTLATTEDIVLQPYGGNVGIGTTEPAKKLEVADNTNVSAYIRQSSTNDNDYAQLLYGVSISSAIVQSAIRTTRVNGGVGRLGLMLSPDALETGLVERLSILSNGNVGIGTQTPTQELDVNGSATIQGNLNITQRLYINSSCYTYGNGTCEIKICGGNTYIWC